jgi:HAD superfamily hydrolase (TIGR01509 family)
MKKNLVIFDFDGVIADSEKVWLKNRQEALNKLFNLNWDFQTTYIVIGGMSDKDKRQVLNDLKYETDDDFWKEQLRIDMEVMRRDGLRVFDGVEDLIKKLPKKCIATGGVKAKTIVKLEVIGFWNKYFNDDNLFTVDMVEKGKPEPDLFLLAAKSMGEKPENCIVIEDSYVGIRAAQRAGMEVIAFLGGELNNNDNYLKYIQQTGVKYVCYNMKEVEKVLLDF